MAKDKKHNPVTPPPPLPPTAAHAPAIPLPSGASSAGHGGQVQEASAPAPIVAEPAPLVHMDGVQMEAHPVGTAQYIAELEAENAEALKMQAAVAGRATEGFKQLATNAITHAAVMAGHLPQDINAIPGIDAINAAGAGGQ